MPVMLKKIIWIIAALMIVFASCARRPQYKTRSGRKKLKVYNMHQFDSYKKDRYQMKQMKKKTRRKH